VQRLFKKVGYLLVMLSINFFPTIIAILPLEAVAAVFARDRG
jgi:hypothetical protein